MTSIRSLDTQLRDRARGKLTKEIDGVLNIYLPAPLSNATYNPSGMHFHCKDGGEQDMSIHQALYQIKKAIFDSLIGDWEEAEIREFIRQVDRKRDE